LTDGPGRRQTAGPHPAKAWQGAGCSYCFACTGRFLAWATIKAAHRVSVTAYAGNEGALRFYARYGFAPRSVILDRDIA
jgi:GNAT superfamily N-acetyltransferase